MGLSKQKPSKGDLRVWWIPQVPGKAFDVDVKNIEEAKLVLNILAEYDKFQFETHIKGDYANTGGLEQFGGVEWLEWNNEEGEDIDELMRGD